jgi:molybdopterin/thiamine biosynthesis adenylyltransferase
VLADDDDVHVSNLQRQILFTSEDIASQKRGRPAAAGSAQPADRTDCAEAAASGEACG